MNLEQFCHDSWVIRKGRLRESRHCDQTDLCSLIKQYQAGTISDKDSEKLLKCALCGVGRVQQVWRRLKTFLFSSSLMSHFIICPYKKYEFFDDCFNEITAEVLVCLKTFDAEKLEQTDNLNVMRLLSKYIAGRLHYQKIYEKKIKDAFKDTEELTMESTEKGEDISELKVDLEKIWKDAKENGPRIDDFINEAITGQKPMSGTARAQKKNLKKYIKNHWELSDSEARIYVNAVQNMHEFVGNKKGG